MLGTHIPALHIEQKTTFKSVPFLQMLLHVQCIKLDPLSHSRKVREGLADVIGMHEMLTNQILLFHFEKVATPWLQYVRLIMVQFKVADKTSCEL